MELFFLFIVLIYVIIRLLTVKKTSSENTIEYQPSTSKRPLHESDPELYFLNYQVARSQHDHSAEQFFLLGMFESAADLDNFQDDFDDEENENYDEEYDVDGWDEY